jgi:hypothetical protein
MYIVVDARARRKRRQLSASSYYISNVNPYSSSYSPSSPLTYPSGSFYTGPDYGYGYPNQGNSGDQAYDGNFYGTGVGPYGPANSYNTNNNQYLYGASQSYLYPNLGSTYGSGQYGSSLYDYGAAGFNNQYANWNQGNMGQYYTGGTGNGLSNTGFYWYRKSPNVPFQGRPVNTNGRNPMGSSPPVPFGNLPPGRSPGI